MKSTWCNDNNYKNMIYTRFTCPIGRFHLTLTSFSWVTDQHFFFNRRYLKCQLYTKKNKKMWCDNSPQETKMTQKLTTTGHRTAFNHEQSPYLIVSYKRPRIDNVNQFKLLLIDYHRWIQGAAPTFFVGKIWLLILGITEERSE